MKKTCSAAGRNSQSLAAWARVFDGRRTWVQELVQYSYDNKEIDDYPDFIITVCGRAFTLCLRTNVATRPRVEVGRCATVTWGFSKLRWTSALSFPRNMEVVNEDSIICSPLLDWLKMVDWCWLLRLGAEWRTSKPLEGQGRAGDVCYVVAERTPSEVSTNRYVSRFLQARILLTLHSEIYHSAGLVRRLVG